MLCSKGCNPNAEDGAHTRNSALHLAAQVHLGPYLVPI